MPPSPNDSVVLVGDRKTLPHVYVDSASETGYVRHRSSGGSESGCMTPTSGGNQVPNTPQSQFRNR